MNISRPFIERPVATTLLMIALMLTGIVGYRVLPVSALPEVDYPTIQVTTLYPGASPDVMTSSVTAPLERQFGQMPGLAQMASVSSGGASVITLQFSLDLSLDVAEQEVQAAINAANNYLPTDLPNPPTYSKVNPADTPIMTLSITSPTLPLPKIEDFVDTRLAQKISQVNGVGLVSISGGQRPAVRVQVNPTALAAYGLDMEKVRAAIAAANSNAAKGSFDGPRQASTIDANDQLKSAADYQQVIVAYRNGAPIRLSDIAATVDGAENANLAAWAGATPGIILNIQRQPGANVISVVDNIKRLLPTLQATLPGAINVSILTDRTVTIRASVADVRFELVLAIVLVVMVIFLFLRNISATIIPGVAVPLSLVGTFGVMYLLGFSLNNLTLMALTIATGFVVDDAIVMIENISRYIEEGERPLIAALKGAKQIGFTIISLTFSLIAVLIPLLFMGDIVGRLFREFAITLAVSILISAVISLTLTPMMCSKLLKHTPENQQSKFYHASGRAFDAIISIYARALKFVLNHQFATLLVAIGTLALTVFLFIRIPKGFFPTQDTGLIQGITDASQDISFPAMSRLTQQLAAEILNDPDVESVSSFIGVDGINATLNSGRVSINLKPLEERTARAPEIIRRLQRRVSRIPGIQLYMQPVQDITIDTTVARTQYRYVLQSPDINELATWIPQLMEKMSAVPSITDLASDLQNQGRQAYIEIDRATASRLGITATDIDNALYNAFGQRLISTIFTQSNQYRVVLETTPEFRKDLSALDHIYIVPSGASSATVGASLATPSAPSASSAPTAGAGTQDSGLRTPAGQTAQTAQGATPIRLSTIARIAERPTTLAISRLGQFPSATLSFNLSSGESLGHAVAAIQQIEREIGMPLSIQTSFQGAAQAFQAALSNELWLLIAAIVTMYIILGVLYESFIHPVTILSTLPSASVGALLALMLSGGELDVIGIIGIILLIGIVKKNAIMMIDFALDAERGQNLTAREAIYQACLLRFRPILMTTMAALLSALPLMLSTGMGAELRRPLGISMVGGLILSQVLTLFTTPVIYIYFDRLSQYFGHKKAVTDDTTANPLPQPQ